MSAKKHNDINISKNQMSSEELDRRIKILKYLNKLIKLSNSKNLKADRWLITLPLKPSEEDFKDIASSLYSMPKAIKNALEIIGDINYL